jgi:hypothetical protein
MSRVRDFVDEVFGIDADDSVGEDAADETASQIRVEPGMRCESKRLYERETKYSVEWVDEVPEQLTDPAYDHEAWAEFAIVLRTQFTKGQQRLHSIVVQSPLLKAELKQIFAGYPGLFVGKNVLEMESPFNPFAHRWEALVSACDKGDDSDATRHLQLLKSALEPELQETFAAISDFKTHGAIEFDRLWMIYNPGSFVFSKDGNNDYVSRLIRTEYRFVPEQKRRFFVLHCCIVDYDGKKFGQALRLFAIAQFEGSAGYKDFSAYPLESHPGKQSAVQRLVDRGRKFQALAGVHYRAYDGMASEDSQGHNALQHVRDRFPA